MTSSRNIVFAILLSIVVLSSAGIKCLAQEEPSELRTMLSWFPEIYEGGNVYLNFGYLNLTSVRAESKEVFSFGLGGHSKLSRFPQIFRENIAHILRVKAFSSGYRSMNVMERVSLIRHIKTRKDLPADLRSRLIEGISSDVREDKEIFWEPQVFRLTNGEESLKDLLKAKLLRPTGDSLEGFPIYKLGNKLRLNKEETNWAWFDGQDTLITSNLVDNLALMIYTSQGQEPCVLDDVDYQSFFEKGYSNDFISFSFTDMVGTVQYQHNRALSQGIPAEELEPTKNFFLNAYQYSIYSSRFDDGRLTSTSEFYYASASIAQNGHQGESWQKAKMKSKEERYADIDEVKRDGNVLRITRNYSGKKLEKYVERILGYAKEEMIREREEAKR